MSEEVKELSIDETNKLRQQPGLKPLSTSSTTSNNNNHSTADTSNTSAQSSNDGEISLSIQESKALREKLGLPPLRSSNEKGPKPRDAIHAPAKNTREVISKKRSRPPEAFDQSSQRKKHRRMLPTAKNRDVSNSPEMSRESGNLNNETKVAATGGKAGQKKVVSSASSSSDDMSVSSEEESTGINVGEGKDKVMRIAPIQKKEKGINNVNMSHKECSGLQENVSILESEMVGETSTNNSCEKADNLLVMESSVEPSNIEKEIDGFNQQGSKTPQSLKEASKSIDKGIHSCQQNAQCLSQVEKVSKVAIETQSVKATSKSIDNGIHSRQQNNQCSSQVEKVSNVAIGVEDNASKSNPKDTVGLVNRNPKRKVKEARPVDYIVEGPSLPRVEDKDPLPSANFLAQRFGKTSSVDNKSSKPAPSSSSEKSSGSLEDTSEKADNTKSLSSSTPTSHPPILAKEKVGKQALSLESISKTSATSANVSFQEKAVLFKKPKGRPPKGKRWDSVNGVYVARTLNLPSKVADSPKESSKLPNKEPRLFPKPQGRPRKNCTWDSSNGVWIPNNGDQQMSNKQKSKITFRESLKIKVTVNGEYVNSVPKMKNYGSWPAVFKRPRGRARLGMSWNSRLGKWVPDRSKKPKPPTATSPFKDKMDYLRTMDSNNKGESKRSKRILDRRALHESRIHELKKLYLPNQNLKTSNEDNNSVNLKRGEENGDSDNLKRGEQNNDSGIFFKRGVEKNGKGDNVNSSGATEEELDEIINTNGGTDHALNALLNQAHSSPTKKTNIFGDTSLDGMGESISFANSNHGITTPTLDQLVLNASPLNNLRMSLPFLIEELNRDMERNHDLHHPSIRNSSSSGINQQSSLNSAQREIPPSREQNMDTEGLTSPVIRLLGEVQTPSLYRNPQAEARMAVADQLIHLHHSPILTSREQSPENNTATTRNVNGQIPNFDNSLFSGSAIKPPCRPSSAPPALNPPRPSASPPAIDTARLSFTTANYGRTFSTAVQNNVVPQRLSLGALQQQSATHESLPRVETGRQQTTASTRTASTIQRQDRVPMDRPQAPPVNRNPTAPINQSRPPAEVQVPANQAEPQPDAKERDDELDEVSILGDEEGQPPVVQEAAAAPREERNNEHEEAPIQARNNQDEAAQNSGDESNGNMSYVAGRARFYTEDDSSIDNFVFESGWGSENDSDDSTEPGVVEPHEAARLRNLARRKRLERERQERLREQNQQQQQQQIQRNQQN